jgi:small-conductance mechanosensitive channel
MTTGLEEQIAALVELAAGQARLMAGQAHQLEQQTTDLRSMAGDLKAIRAFMRAHNTKLGELVERVDKLPCMGEPCEEEVGRRRKTTSTELKTV